MQFHLASLLLATLSASAVTPAMASPISEPNRAARDIEVGTVNIMGSKQADGTLAIGADIEARDIEKRGVVVVVLGIVGTAALTEVTKIGVIFAADTIANLNDWTDAREAFTKAVSAEMWNQNPDYNAWPAVACYNKGYRLRNPAGVDGLVTVKLELGVLNTDYDCMYMSGNNQFWTDSDGGYINLAYSYDTSRCTFDGATGDLSCN